jgi:hypothetical protein
MFTMRVRRAVKLALLVAVTATAPAALAATGTEASKTPAAPEKMPPSPAAMMQMDPKAAFQMMDPDKKGYVTKEEFLKFEAKLFEKADKNKDGRLSMPEFTDRG